MGQGIKKTPDQGGQVFRLWPGSSHRAAGFETGGHAVAAQGKAALALVAGFDGHPLDAESVNIQGHELGRALHDLAEGDGVSITDPEHLVGLASGESCGHWFEGVRGGGVSPLHTT